MKKFKVFLGGTCNGTDWRDKIIPKLDIDYFNPVVDDWTPDCQLREEIEKEICNIHLYLITPAMKGVYSIAEIVDSVYKNKDGNKYCVVGFLDRPEEWGLSQWKSLDATLNLIKRVAGDSENIKASWLKEETDILKLIKECTKK